MKFRWWWLLIIGAGLVALALFTPRVQAQEVKPQALYINMGDLYRTHGDSMFPTILDGDSIILPWGNRVKPKIGQIIAFNTWIGQQPVPGWSFTVHRVIEVGEDKQGWWARTKGDNASQPDSFYVRDFNFIGVAWGRLTIW